MDKGTNNQDPSTYHKIDQTNTTDIAPNRLDNRTNKVIKTDNGCKIDSSQRGDWIYKRRRLRKQRLIMYKGTAKGYKIKEALAFQTGPEHKM